MKHGVRGATVVYIERVALLRAEQTANKHKHTAQSTVVFTERVQDNGFKTTVAFTERVGIRNIHAATAKSTQQAMHGPMVVFTERMATRRKETTNNTATA